jgi:hypothetical protein
MRIVILLLLSITSSAIATPIRPPEPPDLTDRLTRHEFGVEPGTQTFRYDTHTQLFDYLLAGTSLYTTRTESFEFQNFFAWSAYFDDAGRVIGPSSMLWFGDFGDGVELLSSGYVKQATSFSSGHADDPLTHLGLEIFFESNYLNPRIEAFGREMVLYLPVALIEHGPSPFSKDFACLVRDCKLYFSSTSVFGLKAVSEPPAVAMMLIVLPMLALWRRRSKTATRVQAR